MLGSTGNPFTDIATFFESRASGLELALRPVIDQAVLSQRVQDVRKQLEKEISLPIKVAVMGCVVNGPGECEGADIAIFAGDRRGIIYVQGEKVANVPEENILEALLKECREFQAKVARGDAKLGEKRVDVIPPDPLGELGSGWEKIQKDKSRSLPVVR